MSSVIPHLAHEQDAALSIYTAGELYVSSSPHAAVVRDLMSAPVLDGEDASSTDTPLGTARAPEPEADSPEHVAAVSLPVVTSERDPVNGDGVQHTLVLHREPLLRDAAERRARWRAAMERAAEQFTPEPEFTRRARLSRWQEQR